MDRPKVGSELGCQIGIPICNLMGSKVVSVIRLALGSKVFLYVLCAVFFKVMLTTLDPLYLYPGGGLEWWSSYFGLARRT